MSPSQEAEVKIRLQALELALKQAYSYTKPEQTVATARIYEQFLRGEYAERERPPF